MPKQSLQAQWPSHSVTGASPLPLWAGWDLGQTGMEDRGLPVPMAQGDCKYWAFGQRPPMKAP